MDTANQQPRKSKRGFAAMDAEKQKEIARKGGRAAHEQGVAHEWSSKEAREAGKKGGQSRKGQVNGGSPL
jgi:general stress protein YciG